MTRNADDYISLTEAAALAHLSVATLRRRIDDGAVPAFRRSRRLFVPRAAALQLAALQPVAAGGRYRGSVAKT